MESQHQVFGSQRIGIEGYEVDYFKLNWGDHSLWVRYTHRQPRGRGDEPELWAILTHRDESGWAHRVAWGGETSCDSTHLVGYGGFSFAKMEAGRVWGEVRRKDGSFVRWDLSAKQEVAGFDHMPSLLRTLRLAKSFVNKPSLRLSFTGVVETESKKYILDEFAAARGCHGHIVGSKYAQRWIWAHGCDAGNVVESLAAKVGLGPVESPWLSALSWTQTNQVPFRLKSYSWNHFPPALCSRSHWDRRGKEGELWGRWWLQGTARCQDDVDEKVLLTWMVEAPLRRFVVVEYKTPQGDIKYCHNTAFADGTLWKDDEKVWSLKEQVSLEVVQDSLGLDPLVPYVNDKYLWLRQDGGPS